jgi:hypothetical protein
MRAMPSIGTLMSSLAGSKWSAWSKRISSVTPSEAASRRCSCSSVRMQPGRLVLVAAGGPGKAVGWWLRLASLSGVVEHLGQPFLALGTRLALRGAQGGVTPQDILGTCRSTSPRSLPSVSTDSAPLRSGRPRMAIPSCADRPSSLRETTICCSSAAVRAITSRCGVGRG